MYIVKMIDNGVAYTVGHALTADGAELRKRQCETRLRNANYDAKVVIVRA